MPLFLPSSSVSLSYFVLAVPMRECLGKHLCMSSPCSIAILNGTFLFPRGEIVCLGRRFVHQNKIKLNYEIWFKFLHDSLTEFTVKLYFVFVGSHYWRQTAGAGNQISLSGHQLHQQTRPAFSHCCHQVIIVQLLQCGV